MLLGRRQYRLGSEFPSRPTFIPHKRNIGDGFGTIAGPFPSKQPKIQHQGCKRENLCQVGLGEKLWALRPKLSGSMDTTWVTSGAISGLGFGRSKIGGPVLVKSQFKLWSNVTSYTFLRGLLLQIRLVFCDATPTEIPNPKSLKQPVSSSLSLSILLENLTPLLG